MAVDPVCGMNVDPSKPNALKSVVDGKAHYFCAPGCKEEFDKDPVRFMAKEKASPSAGRMSMAEPREGDTLVDPACGRTVDPKAAKLTSVVDGRTYYFCSQICKDAFEKVKGAPSPPGMESMTPDPPAQGKAVDPVCGMDVDSSNSKALKSVFEGKTYYFCAASCKEAFDKNPTAHLSQLKTEQPAAKPAIRGGHD